MVKIKMLYRTGALLLFLIPISLKGQQRPVQSLYMFDQLLINPAYAGSQVQLSATSIYRNQWVNLEGAPETFTLSVQSSLLKKRMGLGVVFTRDAIGVHDDTGFFLSYAYNLDMPVGRLSFGLTAGFNQLRSDFTRTNPQNPNGRFASITNNSFNPNFGTGLFYTNKRMFLGVSVPYLLNNSFLQGAEGVLSEARQTRNYYISFGNTFQLSPDFKVIGTSLIRLQEEAPVSFDISANGVIKETVGLGVSYRLEEGVVWLFELKINENFHVGYAYDQTISTISQVSGGSHELMLNYRIKIQKWHRGIECPSYF